jgi:hypothetical protein
MAMHLCELRRAEDRRLVNTPQVPPAVPDQDGNQCTQQGTTEESASLGIVNVQQRRRHVEPRANVPLQSYIPYIIATKRPHNLFTFGGQFCVRLGNNNGRPA